MNDTITLGGVLVELSSDLGHEFTENCVRAGEGLIDDRELAEIYELTPADFQAISKDAALIRAIRITRDRRVRTGQAAREAAAKHFVKAPGILDRIMSTESSNDRHKIEAARELRQVALPQEQNTPAQSERFHIVINLGEDTEVYDKSICVNPNDSPPEQSKIHSLEQPKIVHTLEQSEKRKQGRPRKLTAVPNDGANNTTKAIPHDNDLTDEAAKKFIQAFYNE